MKTTCLGLVMSLLVATAASAAPTPEAKCQAAKNKAAGNLADCRQAAEAKRAQTGDAAKYDAAILRCESAFAAAFAKAEAAAAKKNGACPTSGDAAGIESMVTAHADTVAASLAPGGAVPACGDGAINVIGEQCDTADLGGMACADLGHPDGALACNASCRFDAGDCRTCESEGGVFAAGSCWFLAASAAGSCDAMCASHGRVCNEAATRDHAGSGGTLADCTALVNALDPVAHTPLDADNTSCGSPDLAVGCGVVDSFMGMPALSIRVTAPVTTCAADGEGGSCSSAVRRVCACD
jgi:hypothetical protein